MTSKRVLVAYGSKHGATAGIADELGKTLREDRFDTAVQSADSVTDLNGYDAVVLGGALYAGRWNGSAPGAMRSNSGTALSGSSAAAPSTAPPSSAAYPPYTAWPAG